MALDLVPLDLGAGTPSPAGLWSRALLDVFWSRDKRRPLNSVSLETERKLFQLNTNLLSPVARQPDH